MKNIYIIGALAVAGALSSCNDFLDKQPLDTIVDKPEYWNQKENVKTQTDRFYNYYLGYGDGRGEGTFYFDFLNDDQASASFTNWKFTEVPGSDDKGYWSTPYERIRGCNYVIQNVRTSKLEESNKLYFEGVARMNRAYQYFTLVRRFGDVIWENRVIESTSDPVLYGPRTSRDVVMDSVLADLQYAVATIGTADTKSQWSSDMAQAMLAEVALFEGTYCKYRTLEENKLAADEGRAQKYLKIAADAAESLINSGNYTLEDEYGTMYHSYTLGSSSEIIFFKPYSVAASFGHSLVDYISNTSPTVSGMSKNAFDGFLFRDGKPLCEQSAAVKDEKPVVNGNSVMIENLLALRDKRLESLIDPGLAFGSVHFERYVDCKNFTSSTGYTVRKFYGENVLEVDGPDQLTQIGGNHTQAPIYHYAQILLTYAEALCELNGTLTQPQMDLTINALNARGDIAALTTSPAHDTANNMGVSDLLWEIRRCRRCELMFDGNRYWDLVRWHQLQLLSTTDTNRSILTGAYVADVDASLRENISLSDGYIDVTPGANRQWNPRYYFYPIPLDQLALNKQLGQNPGWAQ